MAKAENQAIPSYLLTDYSKVLAPTRFLNTNYGKDNVHRDSCERKYPDHPAQADNPSEKQSVERWTFAEACEAWQNTTPQEQSAYYQLSIVTGWFHFNFFMSRFILALLNGAHWEELLRPDALRYDMGSGDGAGEVGIQFDDDEQGEITWDIELDPATWVDCGYPGPHVPHYIIFSEEKIPPAPYPPYFETVYEFNPTERTRFTGYYTYGQGQNEHITATFYRSATEAGPCVLWQFGRPEGGDPTEIVRFLPG